MQRARLGARCPGSARRRCPDGGQSAQTEMHRNRAAASAPSALQLLPDAGQISASPETSLRWEKLAKLAHGCKEKNERNGMLIRWQHKYIEQTLAVLRNDGGAESTLYGPDGGSQRNGARRGSLGSA